ncbi:hypothetical protein D9615_002553 [Tricholomella constricta]|uniref:Uncharacterized protein n=1 Tax=Tricholomella constricta TaxID=117010 RepID=A0A8H5M9W0_9AGAR|nr:hypothetical protein D9615_002553 [Tricholomella constricta]
MHFQSAAGPSNPNPSPESPPKLSGSTPGLLDYTQADRLCRLPGSKLSFASFDPHTASLNRDIPGLDRLSLNEQLYRPKRVVIEIAPSGASTWRFVPSARRDDGVPDEGTWPRVVDICGHYFLCSQEQWDIYKLDPLYDCLVRAAPHVPIITHLPDRPQAAPTPVASGQKRRVVSPTRESPAQSPKPRKKRAAQVQSESEDDESEVEDMVIDAGFAPPKSPAGPSNKSTKFRETIQANRKERQERMARRMERLSRLENGSEGESSSTAPRPSERTTGVPPFVPANGKRKGTHRSSPSPRSAKGTQPDEVSTVTSLFDSLRTNGTHEASGSTRPTDDEPLRNTMNYVSTQDAKRTRTGSPSAAKRNLAASKQAREKQKIEQRRKEQEARRMAREAELLQELYRNNPDVDMPDASQGTGSASSDEDSDEDGGDGDGVGKSPVPADAADDEEEVRRLAAIAESRRKLAELEADRPLWEAAAAQRKEQERKEAEAQRVKAEKRKRAEEAERRAKEQREQEEQWKREEEEAYRKAREEATRRYAEQEERARQQRAKRERDSWSHGYWTVERAKERYGNLAEHFDKAKYSASELPLAANDVPWPMLARNFDLEDVTWQAVADFFNAVRPTMKTTEFKKFIIKSHLRFHTDRHSDVSDQQQPSTSHVPIAAHHELSTQPGRRSPPLVVPQSLPQTRSVGGAAGGPQTHVDPPPPRPNPQPRRSLYHRTMAFLGVGRGASRERRSLVALFLNLASGSTQIIVITILLALIGTRFKSPTDPELTEWQACSRPLGVWACIWVGRALLASSLNYWGFLRDRQQRRQNRPNAPGLENQDPPRDSDSSPRVEDNAPSTPHVTDHSENPVRINSAPLSYTLLYSRLTLLSSLLTLSWFLTAHILEYTSVNTCRHSSPHLWWLTFGILCLMYLMVLEVIMLGFVVFVIAPILFLFWNIVLICIGRHPLQTSNMIKPEIGKLPKAIVDRIPLVMYIPPPPEIPPPEKLAVPEPAHGYPPRPTAPAPITKSRFRFIRRFSSFQNKKGDNNTPDAPVGPGNEKDVEKDGGGSQTWEAHWEQGEYPLVVLEGNRAACAICLMDFEEPKRKRGTSDTAAAVTAATATATPAATATASSPDAGPSKLEEEGASRPVQSPAISIVPVQSATAEQQGENDDELHLADAGEGAQPLRLLACGHVFHVSPLLCVILVIRS